jgi:hypothetical protein
LNAEADVFYIHPTSYVGRGWNASTHDAELNDATDRVATGIQASAFNGCCAVYAPRYRQANGTAFYRPSADGQSPGRAAGTKATAAHAPATAAEARPRRAAREARWAEGRLLPGRGEDVSIDVTAIFAPPPGGCIDDLNRRQPADIARFCLTFC